MVKTPYFKTDPSAPAPLTAQIRRAVRFDELDPLAIMWHGHYASFFEEARVALGEKYGIGYLDFHRHGMTIPLRKFHVDYFAPLEFTKTYTVRAFLHFNLAAHLDFEFEIYNQDSCLVTRGYTVHMMLDASHNVVVTKPAFFEEFCQKWQAGLII